MFVLAHADHPEMFVAGLVVGVAVAAVHFIYRRVTKK